MELSQIRRSGPPCLRAFRAAGLRDRTATTVPSPSTSMPVLSAARQGIATGNVPRGIGRCSGPLDPRYGMFAASVFWRRQTALKSGTPVETDQPRQAFDEPGRLTGRHRCSDQWRDQWRPCRAPSSTGRSGWRHRCRPAGGHAGPSARHPIHRGIEPDGQRAPAPERFVVGWPVPGFVGRG